jgi:hypothetical protein
VFKCCCYCSYSEVVGCVTLNLTLVCVVVAAVAAVNMKMPDLSKLKNTLKFYLGMSLYSQQFSENALNSCK